MQADIAIIGGGLAGLRLADLLHQAGQSFVIIEARDRFGGRILTETIGQAGFDMGPAWFWPGQPRIAALAERFVISTFEQYSNGLARFEDGAGNVETLRGLGSMQGSLRLGGGMQSLTEALLRQIPEPQIRRGAAVTHIANASDRITLGLSDGTELTADQIVLALPPRIAFDQIEFSPPLPDEARSALRDTPTWMAGQAKAIAIYPKPFWREAGLSGDAASRHGPMVEIHDASPMDTGPYALFGFIGVPAQARTDEAQLRAAVIAQLGRLFGSEALRPEAVLLKDWAHSPFTAMSLDHAPLYAHPSYGMPEALRDLWQGKLIFGATEVAAQFGGYLEGALEAAEYAYERLKSHRTGFGVDRASRPF
jgi:monoamine oxidase